MALFEDVSTSDLLLALGEQDVERNDPSSDEMVD